MGRKTQTKETRVRDYYIERAREEYAASRREKMDWVHYVSKVDFARKYVQI